MPAHYFTVDEAVQRLRNEGVELELDAFESVSLEELARVRGSTVTIQGKTFFAYTNDIHELLSAVRLHLQHGQRSDLTPKKDCDSMMVLLTREHMRHLRLPYVDVTCGITTGPTALPKNSPLRVPKRTLREDGYDQELGSLTECSFAIGTGTCDLIGYYKIYACIPHSSPARLDKIRKEFLRTLQDTHDSIPELITLSPPVTNLANRIESSEVLGKRAFSQYAKMPIFLAALERHFQDIPTYFVVEAHELKRKGKLFASVWTNEELRDAINDLMMTVASEGYLDQYLDLGIRGFCVDMDCVWFPTEQAAITMMNDFGFSELEHYPVGGVRDFCGVQGFLTKRATVNGSYPFLNMKIYQENLEGILNSVAGTLLGVTELPLLPVQSPMEQDPLWLKLNRTLSRKRDEVISVYLSLLDAIQGASLTKGGATRLEVRVHACDFELAMDLLDHAFGNLGSRYPIIKEKKKDVFRHIEGMAANLLAMLWPKLQRLKLVSTREQVFYVLVREALTCHVISRVDRLRRNASVFNRDLRYDLARAVFGFASFSLTRERWSMDLEALMMVSEENSFYEQMDMTSLRQLGRDICQNREFEIACYLDAHRTLLEETVEVGMEDLVGYHILNVLLAIYYQILTHTNVLCRRSTSVDLLFTRGPYSTVTLKGRPFELSPEALAPFVNKRLLTQYGEGLGFVAYHNQRAASQNVEAYMKEILDPANERFGYVGMLSAELRKSNEDFEAPSFLIYRLVTEIMNKYSRFTLDRICSLTAAAFQRAGCSVLPRFSSTNICVASTSVGLHEFLKATTNITTPTETNIPMSSTRDATLIRRLWRPVNVVVQNQDLTVVRELESYSENEKTLIRSAYKMSARQIREVDGISFNKIGNICEIERISIAFYVLAHGDNVEDMYLDSSSGLTRRSGGSIQILKLCDTLKEEIKKLKAITPSQQSTLAFIEEHLLNSRPAWVDSVLKERDRVILGNGDRWDQNRKNEIPFSRLSIPVNQPIFEPDQTTLTNSVSEEEESESEIDVLD